MAKAFVQKTVRVELDTEKRIQKLLNKRKRSGSDEATTFSGVIGEALRVYLTQEEKK